MAFAFLSGVSLSLCRVAGGRAQEEDVPGAEGHTHGAGNSVAVLDVSTEAKTPRCTVNFRDWY
jgi:hypothetical protein